MNLNLNISVSRRMKAFVTSFSICLRLWDLYTAKFLTYLIHNLDTFNKVFIIINEELNRLPLTGQNFKYLGNLT